MRTYTVHEVARMAGVSVRTLHHYDRIGLLAPATRAPNGYRLYDEAALLRLQQILFYRELDVPLRSIREILDDPSFDPLQALEEHRDLLLQRIARLERLLGTIDGTIARIKGDTMALKDEELYEGLAPEEAEKYRREARERYGEAEVRLSEERLRKLSTAEWEALKQEGGEIYTALAERMDRDPADAEVQALIARHHAHINRFWQASPAAYRGLGRMYAEDDRFRAFYDRVRPGLAEFMRYAIDHYADALEEGE